MNFAIFIKLSNPLPWKRVKTQKILVSMVTKSKIKKVNRPVYEEFICLKYCQVWLSLKREKLVKLVHPGCVDQYFFAICGDPPESWPLEVRFFGQFSGLAQ